MRQASRCRQRSSASGFRGKGTGLAGSISIGRDGRVYSSIRVDNETGFGTGYLHHIVRYDPETKQITDLGFIAVKNPDFFDFKGPQAKNPDGSLRPRHGYTLCPTARSRRCT